MPNFAKKGSEGPRVQVKNNYSNLSMLGLSTHCILLCISLDPSNPRTLEPFPL